MANYRRNPKNPRHNANALNNRHTGSRQDFGKARKTGKPGKAPKTHKVSDHRKPGYRDRLGSRGGYGTK